MLQKIKALSTGEKVTAIIYLLCFSSCLGAVLIIVLSPLIFAVMIMMIAVAIDGEASYEEVLSSLTEDKDRHSIERDSGQYLDTGVMFYIPPDSLQRKAELLPSKPDSKQIIELECVLGASVHDVKNSDHQVARYLTDGNTAICSGRN